MTKPTSFPIFSSPELQKALESARPALEGAEDARNRVSQDIKALEAYLESLSIKSEVRHRLGYSIEKPEGMDESQFTFNGAELGSGTAVIVEMTLVWGPDGNGRNRLLYEIAKFDGFFDIDLQGGPYFPDRDTVFSKESKPLIEWNFETRKTVYESLPKFIEAVGEAVRVAPLEEHLPFF